MCVGGREGVARGVALGMSSGMSRWVRGRQSQAGVVSPLAVRPSTRRVDRSVGAGALPALPPLASLSATTQSLPTEAISGLADGLELPVQLIYLMTLLGFLSFGAIVVVREVLSKRGMDEMAKEIGERVRMQEASAGDYYELGVILLRKKLFTQANQNLKKALKAWREGEGGEGGEEGEGEEAREELLAQVHNALGYSYFNLDRYEEAIKQYKTAVEMQPGYLTVRV